MTAPTPTLTQQADECAQAAEGLQIPGVAIRRAFMAGALAALTAHSYSRDQLLAECLAFGRGIGTAAERAMTTTQEA